jgi:hypothetical protein
MENKETNNTNTDWANAFNDPFKSGLIKEDAIDKILADKKLMEIINKIKL